MDDGISIKTDKMSKAIGMTTKSIEAYYSSYNDAVIQLKKYESSITDDISNNARQYLVDANKAIKEAISKLSQMNDNLSGVVDMIEELEKRGLKL